MYTDILYYMVANSRFLFQNVSQQEFLHCSSSCWFHIIIPKSFNKLTSNQHQNSQHAADDYFFTITTIITNRCVASMA